MKNASILAMLASALFGSVEYRKLDTDFRYQRNRKRKGAGRGGFHPPRHNRARAHKKAFGGLCGPRLDATQFFYE